MEDAVRRQLARNPQLWRTALNWYFQAKGTRAERTRRLTAANEAIQLGYGGVSLVHRACGLSRKAIAKGMGRHINQSVKRALAAGWPVISVDTKKKELVGNYANSGQQWLPAKQPQPAHPVRDRLYVIQNWFAEIRECVPPKRRP